LWKVEELRGLIRAVTRPGDQLCRIAGPGCPYTLPIAGRPLIAHAVRALRDAGVSRIVVAIDAPIAEHVAPAVEGVGGADVEIAIQAIGDTGAPLLVMDGDMLAGEIDTDALVVKAAWQYDGTIDGILEANSLALDALKPVRIDVDLSNTTVQGRVHIDPSAELDGAKVRGPAYIGPGARIIQTYVGPYSSIGAGVTLEGVEIEHSIVLPHAQIRFPGRRLESSLVGEGAEIARDYTLPSALRLRVGPGSQIQLS
jgi:NDP-sugar pyrophosphorylase family protein